MYTKKMFSLAMAAFLSAMAVFPVYAGTEKIDTVRLEFSYDKEPDTFTFMAFFLLTTVCV